MVRDLSRVFLMSFLLGCSAKAEHGAHQPPIVPAPWIKLVPADGLEEVRKGTNEDTFVADYSGCTAEQLLARVERSLVDAGYGRTCTQFEGRVRGYSKGQAKLLVKVDALGPVQALLVSNEHGPEPLLFGVCFKGYQIRRVNRDD